jgi:hypothetical protein
MESDETKLEVLFKKLQSQSRFTQSEIQQLILYLRSSDEMIQARAIQIAGYAGYKEQFLDVIKSVLQTTKEVLVACEAIWTISRAYSDAISLRPIVVRILSGYDTTFDDITGSLLRSAVVAAGDILAQTPDDREILTHLISLIDTQDVRPIIKDEAYRSLTLPSDHRQMGNVRKLILPADFDLVLLDEIRLKLKVN